MLDQSCTQFAVAQWLYDLLIGNEWAITDPVSELRPSLHASQSVTIVLRQDSPQRVVDFVQRYHFSLELHARQSCRDGFLFGIEAGGTLVRRVPQDVSHQLIGRLVARCAFGNRDRHQIPQ